MSYSIFVGNRAGNNHSTVLCMRNEWVRRLRVGPYKSTRLLWHMALKDLSWAIRLSITPAEPVHPWIRTPRAPLSHTRTHTYTHSVNLLPCSVFHHCQLPPSLPSLPISHLMSPEVLGCLSFQGSTNIYIFFLFSAKTLGQLLSPSFNAMGTMLLVLAHNHC